MNTAAYIIRNLTERISEIAECSTANRIFLGTQAECEAKAKMLELRIVEA